jgi:hypothetical protein
VNEPAGEQITELLNDDLQLTNSDNLDGTDDVDEERPIARTREGLPPAFRMRHDAHYVDELMSRRIHDSPPMDSDDAPRRAAPAAPPERAEQRTENRAPAEAPAPPPVSAALALIADRLESLAVHGDAVRTPFPAASFVAQSVQVEFNRVTRLARAAACLQDREPPLRAELSAREIGDALSRDAGPVARLAGIELDVAVDDPDFSILADPATAGLVVAGTVDAVVDLLLSDPRRQSAAGRRHSAARVSISLQTVKVRPAIIIDLFCPTLFINGTHAARFFDNAADDYRGAPAAGVLLAAAAHIARAHGGRADIKRHSAAGATITYVFPQTP